MNVICPTCRRPNPSHARYCACCGRALRRSGCRSGSCRGLLVTLAVVGLVLWSTGWRGVPMAWVSKVREAVSRVRSPQLVRRHLELNPAKADAFFKLLAPADVQVLVARTDRGISIKGTPHEADVLADFAGLLTRHERACGNQRFSMDKLAATWTVRQTYTVPAAKARTLYDLLADDDVPVYVQRHSQTVVVDASESDQKTIAGVVDILHGKR